VKKERILGGIHGRDAAISDAEAAQMTVDDRSNHGIRGPTSDHYWMKLYGKGRDTDHIIHCDKEKKTQQTIQPSLVSIRRLGSIRPLTVHRAGADASCTSSDFRQRGESDRALARFLDT
jgi:hypothetical protein